LSDKDSASSDKTPGPCSLKKRKGEDNGATGNSSSAKLLAKTAADTAMAQKQMVENVAQISKSVTEIARLETNRDINNLEDKVMELEMR